MSRAGAGTDWDLVVVGGGGCGLAGAIAAAQEGARVVLLEKSEHLGGNTARSIGSVPGAGTRFQVAAGIADDPQRFFRDLWARTGGRGDSGPTRRMCEVSAGLVHWLVDDVGVDLRLTTDYKHVAHSVNRLHNPPSREGTELIASLEGKARALGVVIELEAPVHEIAVHDDAIAARVGEGDTKEDWLSGESVLLATNGFGGAPDLVEEYCGRAGALSYFGAPSNTGDGLRWGRGLGARLANLDSYLGYAVMAVPLEGPATYETLFSWTILEIGGIAVDSVGRRFGNEDEGYSAFSDTVLANGGGRCHVVFDQRMMEYVTAHEPRFANLVARTDSPVQRAEDLGALAAALGVEPGHLERSVQEYAAAASAERPDQFGRTEFGMAPLQGPFYGCRTEPGILTTQGGVVVDDHSRVVLESGDVLHRVYAGGSAAAGISGNQGAQGYASGNGLLTALGYGMLAGRHVAGRRGVSV